MKTPLSGWPQVEKKRQEASERSRAFDEKMAAEKAREERLTGGLRLCPFCNGIAMRRIKEVDWADYHYWVECRDCEASTSYYDDDKDADAAWNRRGGE